MKRTLLFTLFIFITINSLVAQESGIKSRIRTLNPGKPVYSLLELSSEIREKEFSIEIPRNASGFKISLTEASGDLSLQFIHGEIELESATSEWNETLTWNTPTEGNLPQGTAKVTVSADIFYLSTLTEPYSDLSFILLLEWTEPPRAKNANLNQNNRFLLQDETQNISIHQLGLSTAINPLLFNWKTSQGSAKVFIKFGKIAWKESEADYSFDIGMIESDFILDSDSATPLKRGNWYLTFINTDDESSAGEFSAKWIQTTSTRLSVLTGVPIMGGNEIEAAMSAVVAVKTSYRTVAGAFISSKGDVLTSYSGIASPSGETASEIVVAVSPSIHENPVFAFTAQLISYNKKMDLALLKLKEAAYGKTVPANWSFPYLKVANSLEISTGQPINILDFPFDRITGKADTIVSSRETIGGFEKQGNQRWFKVNTMLGGAGGIAINVYHEIVGINAVMPRRTKDSSVVYFTPVEDFPTQWQSIIRDN